MASSWKQWFPAPNVPAGTLSPVTGAVYSDTYDGPRPTNPDGTTMKGKAGAGSTTDQGVQTPYGLLSAADKAQIDQMLGAVQSTDDPMFWYGLAAQHGGVQNTGVGWLTDRINRGDGSILVKNGTLQKFQDGPAGGAGTVDPYTLPSSTIPATGNPASFQAPIFTAPTYEDLQKMPGYQAGLALTDKTLQASAAAKGSLLDGGFVNALQKAGIDYTNTKYGDLFNQSLAGYGANVGAKAQAFGLNQNAFQDTVSNSLSQYQQRYKAYQDAIDGNFKLAGLGAPTPPSGIAATA